MDIETRIVGSNPGGGVCGLCLSCPSLENGAKNYQDLVDKLSSAVRLCKYALAACFFFSVLLLLMFSCSVYLFMEIRTVRQEIARCDVPDTVTDDSLAGSTVTALYLRADGDLEGSASQGNEIIDKGRHFRSHGEKGKNVKSERKVPGKRGKKGKDKCCKWCKKMIRGLSRKVRSLQNIARQSTPVVRQQTAEKPRTTPPPGTTDKNRISHIAAGHYTTYMTDEFINQRFGVLDPGRLDQAVKCKPILEWQGEACRNRTFSPQHVDGSALTLNIFQEADWMKNISQEPIFDKTQDGAFIARHSGIYLLYAHVLFYDAKTKQAIAVVQESGGASKNVLRCMESTDSIDPSQDIGNNSRYKSCSVTGVLYMNAGDKVMVKNLYSETRIDLTSDATYFGGLLFAVRDGT